MQSARRYDVSALRLSRPLTPMLVHKLSPPECEEILNRTDLLFTSSPSMPIGRVLFQRPQVQHVRNERGHFVVGQCGLLHRVDRLAIELGRHFLGRRNPLLNLGS